MSCRFFQTCSIRTGDSKQKIYLHNRLGNHPEQLQHRRTQELENLATGNVSHQKPHVKTTLNDLGIFLISLPNLSHPYLTYPILT